MKYHDEDGEWEDAKFKDSWAIWMMCFLSLMFWVIIGIYLF